MVDTPLSRGHGLRVIDEYGLVAESQAATERFLETPKQVEFDYGAGSIGALKRRFEEHLALVAYLDQAHSRTASG